ncbi:MerR family transcriptional regulator [Oscillospiraceae bacterium]|nr:MerR family transcriptional regulator [Oscillospiraceae bacterium]
MQDAYMSIKEFSRLTGINRELLRFYDKIGLLTPEARGKNSYRYYGYRQLEVANLISGLRSIDVGLEDIKSYLGKRSPEQMIEFFQEKDANIGQEIERLQSIQELMRLRCSMAKEAMSWEEDRIILMEREREPIFLCPILTGGRVYSDGVYGDNIISAYMYALNHGININFPVGTVVPRQNLTSGPWPNPSRCYFKVSKNHNAWKSAGTYAVVYRRYPKTMSETFYRPLLTFLEEQGLQMDGDAYEEYPLDELTTNDREQSRIKIEVKVSRS